MRYTEKTFKPVPAEYSNIKQVQLDDINEFYILLENGLIWSRVAGRFLTPYVDKRNNETVILTTRDGHLDTTIPYLVRKYFKHDETFGGIESKPVLGLEDKYIALADGRIYSLCQYKFLTESVTQTGWKTVCLVNKNGKRFSAYPSRLVWEAFNGPLPKEQRIIFKDGDKTNCSLDNLDTEIKIKYRNMKG